MTPAAGRFPALCAVCADWIESASSADEVAEPPAHRHCAQARGARALVSALAGLVREGRAGEVVSALVDLASANWPAGDGA